MPAEQQVCPSTEATAERPPSPICLFLHVLPFPRPLDRLRASSSWPNDSAVFFGASAVLLQCPRPSGFFWPYLDFFASFSLLCLSMLAKYTGPCFSSIFLCRRCCFEKLLVSASLPGPQRAYPGPPLSVQHGAANLLAFPAHNLSTFLEWTNNNFCQIRKYPALSPLFSSINAATPDMRS